jgi:hypothetical protein
VVWAGRICSTAKGIGGKEQFRAIEGVRNEAIYVRLRWVHSFPIRHWVFCSQPCLRIKDEIVCFRKYMVWKMVV